MSDFQPDSLAPTAMPEETQKASYLKNLPIPDILRVSQSLESFTYETGSSEESRFAGRGTNARLMSKPVLSIG